MTAFSQLGFSFAQGTHQNHFLFSDHYLNNLLPKQAVWEAGREETAVFSHWLRDRYQQERDNLPGYNEAQLEDHWIRPILDKLGWEGAAETQAVIPALAEANIRKPDYVFFPTVAARQAAAGRQNSPAYAQEAVAVGEAKRWTAALDKKVRGGAPNFDNNNPSYQIDYYLRATDVTWGVLTNGRLWRLVHKDSSYKLDVYFEIDLETAVQGNHLAALRYFTLFFGRSSFLADENGRVFVNEALSESVRYARELEADLRDNAYKALEQIITGFFALGRNQLDPANPDHLQQVYTNSLYLLYRLLFLLYGESRGLLPLGNPHYRAISLTALVEETDPTKSSTPKLWSPYMRQIWCRLGDLCRVIAGSDVAMNQDMGVPRYNGGLFSPVLHPFLEKKAIGDSYLVQAVDYLARRDSHKQGDFAVKEPVDYRTLGVRQLGSIYEGLLEYAPRAATEPMVTVRRKGQEVWLPAVERGKAKALEQRQVGELYLATDKGERKATGSYYTPDYIVKYIVEQTLNPLIEQARQRVKAGAAGKATAQANAQRFIDEILALKVLDPAMGSGHFLVEATDHLARALATDEWVQGESGSDDAEADLVYWRRRVVEACIYGVDKNPMAVELAKLSLWLVTVAKDKPLSFLDHHLRHGDSLVGARLADLVALPSGKKSAVSEQQLPLLNETTLTQDLFRAVGGMSRIEGMLSESLADVYAKEGILAELRQQLAGWRTLADVWTSSFFGNAMSPEEYREVARHLQGEATGLSGAQLAPFLQHAAVTDNDYFHWELAFPEVFFDIYGRSLGDRAGFDAVIGNPPYVRQEVFADAKLFLQEQFETYHGQADLYIYFLEHSVKHLHHLGYCGLIVSHKFMRADYGQPLRRFLIRWTRLQSITHFGDLPVFADAAAYPAIISLRRAELESPLQKVWVTQVGSLDFAELTDLVAAEGYLVSNNGFAITGWSLKNGLVESLQAKLQRVSQPLGQYVQQRIFYGIKTGLNRAFFIDEATRSLFLQKQPEAERLIKPLVVGEDLNHYYIDYQKRYLLLIPSGWTKEMTGLEDEASAWAWLQQNYPVVAEHLALFTDEAKSRYDKGMFWWELRPCDYYEVFEQPKIIYPVIARDLRFAFDETGYYANDKCFVIAVADNYLLALLNARLTYFFAKHALSGLRGDYLEFRATHLQNLPIFLVQGTTENTIREVILERVQQFWQAENYREVLLLLREETAVIGHDVYRDLLAWLGQKMTVLNVSKRQIEQRFWLDLEGVAGDELAKLQKGKWEESLHREVAAARPFVRPDSRSTRTLEESLGWNEAAFRGFVRLLLGKVKGLADLVEVYNSYHADYAALVQRIAATDALIDQIVYKLYGLTDEEIAIVEGAG